jgi:hypothetical protein
MGSGVFLMSNRGHDGCTKIDLPYDIFLNYSLA